jgi:hypothetical protein
MSSILRIPELTTFLGMKAASQTVRRPARSISPLLKKTLPIIGQIILKKRESRFGYFYYRKKRQWRVPLFGNLGYNFLLRIHTKFNVISFHDSSEGIDKDSN